MAYIVIALLGMLGGAFCCFMVLESLRRTLREQKAAIDRQTREMHQSMLALAQREEELRLQSERLALDSERIQTEAENKKEQLRLDSERIQTEAENKKEQLRLDSERIQTEAELELERVQQDAANIRDNLKRESERLRIDRAEFQQRVVSYAELQEENTLLKRDLRNVFLDIQKAKLDYASQRQSQETLNTRIQELGTRYLNENMKWVGSALNQNNFVACKKRLQDVIDRCRGIGLDVSEVDEATLHANLREEFEKAVRAALLREEQARIKAQIREEQKREKEIQRELERLEREREAIRVALQQALAQAKDQHSEEVERLQARLAEAEERTQRTISQAQLTKAGHVYVISNIGTLGPGVFKIGMTRRLEPLLRVRELGDASVPFPFDVHMMISSNDAPALENALHRRFHHARLNKMKPRKEFFRVDLESIIQLVKEQHGEVDYVVDAEALEYQQSLEMTNDEQEYIEEVYDRLDDDGEIDDI